MTTSKLQWTEQTSEPLSVARMAQVEDEQCIYHAELPAGMTLGEAFKDFLAGVSGEYLTGTIYARLIVDGVEVEGREYRVSRDGREL